MCPDGIQLARLSRGWNECRGSVVNLVLSRIILEQLSPCSGEGFSCATASDDVVPVDVVVEAGCGIRPRGNDGAKE